MHQLFEMDHTQAIVGLRALKAIALADGVYDDRERGLLQAASEALGVDVSPDALDPIAPAEAAGAITDPLLRRRLVEALLVMSLADTEGTRAEADAVEAFAEALGVDQKWVRALRDVAEGHIMRLRFDVMRSSFVPAMVRQNLQKHGMMGLVRFFGPMLDLGLDHDLAWKFKSLGLLPDGTLGRAFWAHMTKNRFAFPGEPQGMPEPVAPHDMIHVLTGYDTDPAGELQIGAFTAAMVNGRAGIVEDPFIFLFSGMLLFHAGINLRPKFGAFKDVWRPEPVLEALARGARCNTNLMEGWDFWQDVEVPVETLRARFGIA